MRLTDISIRQLRPPATGQQKFMDDALPGFGVRVSQGGAKSFFIMYGERRRLKTIGRYPDMKLADARREAKRLQVELEQVQAIVPPSLEQISFETAKVRFLVDSERRNAARTASDYRRLLERHFQFDQMLSEVGRLDIMKVVASLSDTPSEQQHAYVAIRTMLNWCVRQGYIEASPAPRMSVRAASRDRILTDAELAAVLRAARDEAYPFGAIVQLLILTGQRRGEIAALRWDWIDFDQGTLSFPATITKNRRAHTLPLGDMARELLLSLPRLGEQVFPARTEGAAIFNGWGKVKERFDAGLEEVDHYTLHDLRRTFSSIHAKIGTPIHVTEKLLNHISGTLSGIAAVYNRHSYMQEMREALIALENYLRDLVNTSTIISKNPHATP